MAEPVTSPSASPGGSGASTGMARLVRRQRMVLGVAGRVADRLGASAAVVRVAFVVLALAAGWGVVLYAILAALLAGRVEPAARPTLLRRNLGVAFGTAAQVAVVGDVVATFPAELLWPAGLVAFAVALANPELDGEAPTRRATIARVGAGAALMVAGFFSAIAGAPDFGLLWRSGVAALVLVGGLGLILAPWLTRLVASADTDRRDRIRAEERADIAAHLHDSVLQTLTLIQNRASDPQLTAALAHQQERELRRWLYGAGDRSDLPVSFRTALEQVAAEVEDQYLKIVECIVVGDAEMSPAAVGAVAAAREAIVNAAKFAEIPMISVYAEVDDVRMSVFVRDRGVGFELASIPDDRHGVSDSICGRVERLGGTAVVRSTPGAGTEVRIEVPR